MPGRQAQVLIIGDEPVALLLEQLILEEEGYAVTVTASEGAASRILDEINPVLVMLDTGLTGQKFRKLSLSPSVMVTSKVQNDDQVAAGEMRARAKPPLWESTVGGAPVEAALLAKELHVDFVERRVTVAAQEVSLSDIGYQPPYCTACGSNPFVPQRPIFLQNRGDQCLAGAVVLYANLSRIRRRLERFVLRARELIVRAGAKTRTVQELVARRPTLTASLPLRAKLAACLQYCRKWSQYYSWRSPIRKAPDCEDQEQSCGFEKAGTEPETVRPQVDFHEVDFHEVVWSASSNPATFPNPGLDRFLMTQCQTFGTKLEAFLQALCDAYSKVAVRGGNDPLSLAPVVPLVNVYESLHWSPSQTSAYSKKEFARDIYLLHRSGLDTTTSGAQVSFPISRGVPEKTFTTTDENGVEKRYYGIRFMQMGKLRAGHTPGMAPQKLPAYAETRLTVHL